MANVSSSQIIADLGLNNEATLESGHSALYVLLSVIAEYGPSAANSNPYKDIDSILAKYSNTHFGQQAKQLLNTAATRRARGY